MNRSAVQCGVVLGLVVGLVLAAGLPTQAQYIKYYQFPNLTGQDQLSARATTFGMEYILASTSTWGSETVGFTVAGGAWSSTITGGPTGVVVGGGEQAELGWSTWDGNCFLWDLRWGTGEAVVAPVLLGGTPGGGEVVVIDGNYYYRICNTTPHPLYLGDYLNVEYEVVSSLLELGDVGAAAIGTLTGGQVQEIRLLIEALAAEIGATPDIPAPAARSLQTKLENAIQALEDGLAEYLQGDLARAEWFWAKSVGHLENVIKELTNYRKKEYIPGDLADVWIADVEFIIGEYANLPVPAPEGMPDYLAPGECFEFLLGPVPELLLGSAEANGGEPGVVLRGSVVDADGNIVLNWAEQAPLVSVPGVVVTADPPNLWSPDHKMRDITLTVWLGDNTTDEWFIEDVFSSQPVEGTGDGDAAPDWDFGVDENGDPWLQLRSERSGEIPEPRVYAVIVGIGDVLDPDGFAVCLVAVHHDSSWEPTWP